MIKRVTVTRESDTGRNTRFHDNVTGDDMTRQQFVQKINQGSYNGYYVRDINGIPTPCSKPDNKTKTILVENHTALCENGGRQIFMEDFLW